MSTQRNKLKPSLLALAPLLTLCVNCAKPSALPSVTVLPPTPCLLPERPSPRAEVTTLRDCDEEGPGTDACMSQDDIVTILTFVKQTILWTDLALQCPGYQIIKPELDTPEVTPPTDTRKSI